MMPISDQRSREILSKIEGDPMALTSIDEVASTVLNLVSTWKNNLTSKYMDGVDGAPDWLEFEHRIWQLGESLRGALKAKRWKGKNVVLDVAAKIQTDPSLGKGRQTFALLLGEFGGGEYGNALGAMLNDNDVNGHCIKALNKAKIDGFRTPVQEVFESSNGWKRTAAKKYLAIFE